MNKQAKHYDRIHDEYQNHYFDKYSKYYRKEIIFKKIIRILNKSDSILEVGCGGPENLNELLKLSKKINIYLGFDISKNAVELFNKIKSKKFKAFLGDFSEKKISVHRKYDCILFFGALHHMTKNLDETIYNCRKFLKKGGKLILIEPNSAFLNSIRNLWYKLSDKFDHENERALSIEEVTFLCKKNNFINISTTFGGNIGFFVIFNSMIVGTPKFLKYLLFKPLTSFDKLLEKFNSKYISAFHISIWKKN